MRSYCVNYTGMKVGKLTVKSYENGKWLCECECGNTRLVRSWDLKK